MKTKNTEVIDQLYSFYVSEMDNFMKRESIETKKSFKYFERDLKNEVLTQFEAKCKSDENISYDFYKSNFENMIWNSRKNFKQKFVEKLETLKSGIDKQKKKVLDYYKNTINQFFDLIKNDVKLEEKHIFFKLDAIELFKSNITLEEEILIEQISILEQEIEDIYSRIKEKFSEQLKQSELYFTQHMNEWIQFYIKVSIFHSLNISYSLGFIRNKILIFVFISIFAF